jgi:TIR domain/Pentapeptide repeats (8 copies)
MANEEELLRLWSGREEWNAWQGGDLWGPNELPNSTIPKTDFKGVDLSEGDFSGYDLDLTDFSEANLYGTDFSEARFRRANLREANLREADLRGTDLRGTDLRRANLSDANLSGANLSGANLSGANLTRAYLSDANLSGASLGQTIFADVDFRTVKGLNQVEHTGPSEVSISTLYRSEGQIPESFLRGCGVPELLIEYLPSLIGAFQPIQYYSCFISYSSANEEFARRLHGRMQQAKLRVWFAPHNLRGGHKLYDQIDEAIRIYDKLIIVLSEASIRSGWVETELRKAFQKERCENRRTLFPIRLVDWTTLEGWRLPDSSSGKDLAEEVRGYFVPDFSPWKEHDAFEAAFARLLADLKVATETR